MHAMNRGNTVVRLLYFWGVHCMCLVTGQVTLESPGTFITWFKHL